MLLTKQSASNLVIFSQPEMMARSTPLRDKRVRLALNYALNKEAIAKTLFKGYAEPVGQLGFADQTFWDPNAKPIYDTAMAKKLLAEAGYPNGFKLPLGIQYTAQTVNPDLALAVQSALRDIGVEAELKNYEFRALPRQAVRTRGPAEGRPLHARQQQLDPEFCLVFVAVSTAISKGSPCSGALPSSTRLYDQGVQGAHLAKRTELLRRANAAFREDVPIMYTVNRADFLAVTPKLRGVFRVHGAEQLQLRQRLPGGVGNGPADADLGSGDSQSPVRRAARRARAGTSVDGLRGDDYPGGRRAPDPDPRGRRPGTRESRRAMTGWRPAPSSTTPART